MIWRPRAYRLIGKREGGDSEACYGFKTEEQEEWLEVMSAGVRKDDLGDLAPPLDEKIQDYCPGLSLRPGSG